MRINELEINKLTFIDNKDIPFRLRHSGTDYMALFDAIPIGKAVVLNGILVSGATIRAALYRLQKKKKYVNYKVVMRKGPHSTTTYILNKKETE